MQDKSPITNPTSFGQGLYELSSLYLPSSGSPVPRASLELEEQSELLHKPAGDVNYQILAMLSCVNEEMQAYAQRFLEFQSQIKEELLPGKEALALSSLIRTYLKVNTISRADQTYLHIDFTRMEALTLSKNESKKLFWMVLQQDGVDVGHVFIVNQEVTLFSDQPVLIAHEAALQSLTIRTMNRVRIESLSVQSGCRVYASTVDIAHAASSSSDSARTLKAQALEVYCFQQMEIAKHSAVEVEACQIKAGQLTVWGDVECQGDMRIWAEQADVYGNMAVRGAFTSVSLACRFHVKDEKAGRLTTAHLHAREITLLAGKKHEAASRKRVFPKDIGQVRLADVSSQKLSVCSHQIVFDGQAYVEGDIAFEAIDPRARIGVEKWSSIVLNGSIFNASAGGIWFKGDVQENPHLKVSWKGVEKPPSVSGRAQAGKKAIADAQKPAELKLVSQEMARFAQVSITPARSKAPVEVKSASFQPHVGKPAISAPEQKTPARSAVFSAEHLNISGHMSFASPVLVQLRADTLVFSGYISREKLDEEFFEPLRIARQAQEELSQQSVEWVASVEYSVEKSEEKSHVPSQVAEGVAEPPLKVVVQAREIHMQDAVVSVPEDQLGVSAEDSLSLTDSRFKARQLLISAGRDASISGEVEMEGSDKLIMQVGRSVILEKDAKFSLHSSAPALIQADQLRASGAQITFDDLHIRAKSLIQLWITKLKGERLTMETRVALAGLVNFSVEKQISVTAAVSLLGACKVTTDYFVEQSYFRLGFLSLYTPATFNRRSGLPIFLAALNTAISIGSLFAHDPVVQGALIATRFALNAVPALLNAARLGAEIYQGCQKEVDEFSRIRLINQVKTLVFSLASLGFGASAAIPQMGHLFSADAAPVALPGWDDPWIVVNRLDGMISQFAAGFFPGRSINSFLDISADISLEIADSNYSVLDIEGGLRAAVLPVRTNLAQLDLPSAISLTPASSTSTGLLACEMGAPAPLPIGEQSSRYVDYHAASVLPLSQDHHDIQAWRYTAESKQHMEHSTIQADIFSEARGFSAEDSRIITHHLDIDPKTRMALQNSQLLVRKDASNSGDLQAVRSQIQIATLHNQPGALVELSGSQMASDDIQNQGAMVLGGSKLKAGQLENEAGGKVIAIGSKVTLKAQDNAGSVMAMVGSKLEGQVHVEKDAMFTGDAGSDVQLEKLVVKKGGQVGFRDSDESIRDLQSAENFSVDWNHSLSSQLPHQSQAGSHRAHPHHAGASQPALQKDPEPMVAQDFVFHSDHVLKGRLSEDGQTLISEASGPVALHGNALVSPFVLAVVTPEEMKINGHNSSNAPLVLDAKTMEFDRAKSQFTSLDAHADQMHISGGKLNASNGVFLSGGQLTVDNAAHISAAGDVVGKFDDIKMAGKTIVQEEKTVDHGFPGEKTEVYKRTTTFKNVDVESGGNVAFEAKKEMELKGVDMAAEENLILKAKEGLNAGPLQGVNEYDKSHTTLVSSHDQSKKSDVESASHFVAKKEVSLSSENAIDVVADVAAGEKIVVDAPHVKGSASVLAHAVKESSSGLSITLPSLQVPAFRQTPVGQILHPVSSAENADVMSAAMLSLSMGVNTAAATLRALRGGDPLSALLALTGINPTISVSIGHQSASASNQSLGSGGFYAPELVVTAEDATFSNSFGMQVQHSVFHVGKLTFSAADLRSSAECRQAGLTASWGLLSSAPSVSANYARQGSFQAMQPGHQAALGDAVFDVDDMRLIGVQPSVSHASGRIRVLTADAPLEKSAQWGVSAGISSGGSINWSEQHRDNQRVIARSPFAADKPLSDIASDLSVGAFTGIGENAAGLHAGDVHEVPIYDIKQSQARSISFSLGDLFSKPSGEVFSSWRYQSDFSSYRALGDDKWQGIHHHTQITLPIYHPQAGQRFLDDGRWLMTQWHSAAPSAVMMSPKVRSEDPRLEKIAEHSRSPLRRKPPEHVSVAGPETDFVALYDASLSLSVDFSQLAESDESPAIRGGLMPGALPSYPSDVQPLYRGSASKPGQVYNDGFSAHGENTNLVSHWMAESDLSDSYFISTSLEKDMAALFPRPPFSRDVLETSLLYLYEIDSIRPTIDVATELASYVASGEMHPDDYDTCLTEHERVFMSDIFPHEIKGGWEVRMNFPNNILFYSQEYMDGIYRDGYRNRTVGEEFIPNPNYVPSASIQAVGSLAKLFAYSLTGAGLFLDGWSLYHEFQQSEKTGNYDNVYRKGLQISSGWAGAWQTGSFFAEAGALACAPIPYGGVACGLAGGLIGSVAGYYGISEITTYIYDASRDAHFPNQDHLFSLQESGSQRNLLVQDSAPIPYIPLPDPDVPSVAKSMADLSDSDRSVFWQGVTAPFGSLTMLAGHDYAVWKNVSQSFGNFVQSPLFQEYMAASSDWRHACNIFRDIAGHYYEAEALASKRSFLQTHYSWLGNDGLTMKDLYQQPNFSDFPERITDRLSEMDKGILSRSLFFQGMFLTGTLLDGYYQLAVEHRNLFDVIKKDSYSAAGGILASGVGDIFALNLQKLFNREILPEKFGLLAGEASKSVWKDALLTTADLLSPWKVLPFAAMVGGSILCGGLADSERSNEISLAFNFLSAAELTHAVYLREKFGAMLMEAMESVISTPENSDSLLPFLYAGARDGIVKRSTPFGRSLAEYYELGSPFMSLIDVSRGPAGLYGSSGGTFGKVDSAYFRSIVEDLSNFSPANIARLKLISRFLWAGAVGDGLYSLYTAKDKVEEAERQVASIAGSTLAAEVGAALAGGFCGPAAPGCVAGIAAAFGLGGNVLTNIGFDHRKSGLEWVKAHLSESEDALWQPGDDKRLSALIAPQEEHPFNFFSERVAEASSVISVLTENSASPPSSLYKSPSSFFHRPVLPAVPDIPLPVPGVRPEAKLEEIDYSSCDSSSSAPP